MPLYTKEVAQQHLDAWMAAELALSTGQSYSIAGRSLTRVNLTEVMRQIQYWQKQLNDAIRFEQGLGPRRKVRRYVPIDL
ncbi:hypothetical protein JJQ72_06215 [Paenibacillus sp. F411]|uniref:Uncharacterized protein n=1 Tax=Paenibacillus algicola TaxID=2565926 RepID=A0A4P8XM29_9BACL|nr:MULTISPECIES: DUF6148 family protein [Paenibacillus]MBO2943571.1 hypothetical protein [Paenibacillus sp. F411]QCT03826.1 hypothetical protein E6C60_3115 [Paenibacillus algicola]